jgi:hypothetical protein
MPMCDDDSDELKQLYEHIGRILNGHNAGDVAHVLMHLLQDVIAATPDPVGTARDVADTLVTVTESGTNYSH